MKKLINVPEGHPIIVRWFDAWRDSDAYGAAADIKKARLELDDIGFFIKYLDGYLIMAEEKGVTLGDFRHIHHIPIVNIVSVDKLT